MCFLGFFYFGMGAYHAPCYINVTKHGNFPLSDGTFGTALALLERPKGAMDTACATGTPRRDHGTALALMERPKGAYALRQARFPALVSGLEGGIGLGLDGEAAGERSKSVVRTGV